mmetsp:Transcript_3804/g.5183  ORF Transcript_3804/g.5183 Transcript_3804/m.5183 type:complete len:154 (-) Transcript_3804:142-603(-)|eukprot:CAMPEP_0184862780 /NCGR_PEP_ID=MMETSP0580-20130426/7715_1 /TAXON_ID=1118495 /ORGANISM="Dactyliosolen fragilissimus" /LENGTH=153 /DNA_ID=CAMNT_0027360761 /DNA_START=29 /DNA_END=490 /DNA_ORIENTATION=-
MKTSVISTIVAMTLASLNGATAFGSFSGTQLKSVQNSSNLKMEYIPSGLSKEQWRKMKEAEKNKNKGKNLGKVGVTSFKSRSFAEWQKAGGKNLFPVDPKSVKDPKDLPYMQRQGGSADDDDLKKKNPFGNFFNKKKGSEPEPEEKKTNWWTL